jgi:hypothetical protein
MAGALVLGAFLLLLALGTGAAAQDKPGPKRLPDAKITECASCHTQGAPLPKDHASVAGMDLKACRECHAAGSPMSLVGKVPLSHLHQLAGTTCAKCHADVKNPEPVPAAACLQCHDMDKVAETTAKVKPSNPHDSPHYGKKSDCNLCHHQHEKSENYCAQCHSFPFNVP